jgi:hypothetical protein
MRLPELIKNPFAKRPNISERVGKHLPRERGADLRNRITILKQDLERLKKGQRMFNPGVQEGSGREPTEIAEKQDELARLTDLATPRSTEPPDYNPPVRVPPDRSK